MKYFVTTSIPYVNGEPHLGHAMEFVMADVLARA
ncbi:class I tRNA ligase family protein, partial [Candidatus Saccharibacteria bacterium]|nr:class I tRNA ligase family protein [Candidatus Saccharibacteria bacterium]